MPAIDVFIYFASGKVFYICTKNYSKESFFMGRSRNNTCCNFSIKHPILYFSIYRSYSTSVHKSYNNQILNPNWVTGFIDAEGCFMVNVRKNPKTKTGWTVQPIFQINLHKKDQIILERLKSYFGLGNIIEHGKDSISYKVTSIQNLNIAILPHFSKYPLITQKKADYILFKQIVDLMNGKNHLTLEGLKNIVALRASLNLGLSDELKEAFPYIVKGQRPLIENKKILDPFWFAGFASGESTFYLSIFKSKTKLGEAVLVRFSLAQSLRDSLLIKSLVQYLGCGNYSERFTQGPMCTFTVSKFKDIEEKIIPFFEKYPIEGSKSLDYKDLKKVVLLMKDGAHLTSEGLDHIREIKSGMNKGRI